MGDLAEARPYYARALAIREKVLGAEHPDTATSLNNMGALLRAMGELAEARPYYARALAIRQKLLGAEHPDTASSLNNLAVLAYYWKIILKRHGSCGGHWPFGKKNSASTIP
ncbi:MAG: tetratricopeptide repeat protein [Chloroflexi bacterium]|nr:tetratricopeptide repeat protein [Chloroflexota bacterium]